MNENKNFEFLVPYKLKEKFTLFKNIGIKDLIFISIMALLAFIFIIINIDNILKIIIVSSILILTIILLIEVQDDIKLWTYIIKILKFYTKNHNQDSIDFDTIKIEYKEDNILKYDGYYLSILELKSLDYDILSYIKKESKLNDFKEIFNIVKNGKFIKVVTTINYDLKIEKMENTINSLKYKSIKKASILKNELEELKEIDRQKVSKKDSFYLIIYDNKIDLLKEQVNSVLSINSFSDSKLLDKKEIEKFFKFYYQKNEKDKDFLTHNVKESIKNISLDNKKYKILSLTKLPETLTDAWLSQIFTIDNTTCVLSFRKKEDITASIKNLDKTINELKAKREEKELSESKKLSLENKIDKTQILINDLQFGIENLHEIELNLLIEEKDYKNILNTFKLNRFKITQNYFQQLEKYTKINPLIFDTNKKDRLILTSSIMGASFFLISDFFQDEKGIFLGYNKHSLVFFDLFRSWTKDLNYKQKDRVNANMTIIGTPGSGKSFFAKKLLLQQSLFNSKIFILDPENEYRSLVKTLNGKLINVSGSNSGRINPFHIYPTLDNEEINTFNYLKLHLEFLEQFFITLMDLNRNEANFLNDFIKKLYEKFNIYEDTNINNLKETDFPIFDDLTNLIKEYLDNNKLDEEDKKDIKNIYLTLKNYSKNGLHSELWNGYSNINTENDFIVLNFKELFETDNKRIINSQMSVVMNYIQSQINKNYYTNIKNNEDKTVILLVDEAHRFIDNDYPISLNFLFQMSKRIRKYGGSLIVATQNVKDFTGGETKINTKTSAIINNSQYSLILRFNPNDINLLKEMYKNYAGGLNDNELNILSEAKVGNGLLFINDKVKLNIEISTYESDFNIIERKEI